MTISYLKKGIVGSSKHPVELYQMYVRQLTGSNIVYVDSSFKWLVQRLFSGVNSNERLAAGTEVEMAYLYV